MSEVIELEIDLRRDGDQYAVELRYSLPDKDSDVRSGAHLLQFDAAAMLQRAIDDPGYGWYLTERLFPPLQAKPGQPPPTAEQSPREIFGQARGTARERGIPLRLRLVIGSNARELHNICWEKLCDPHDGTPLLTDEKVLFSRYLSSLDWSPVQLRRWTELRALVVVANPDLSDYTDLAQVSVQDELKQVHAIFKDISSLTVLTSVGTADLDPVGAATLKNIRTQLRSECDILYLVCHGLLQGDESMLLLETEEGGVARVSGHALVAEMSKLSVRPRLVVLASCKTAGSGAETHCSHSSALSALGPRLAEAGVPAVVAMQGNVAMDTASEFMPVFFRELQKGGQIDQAVAAARHQVEDLESDWWRPALFMRLKSGRVWYEPGFSVDEHEVDIWPPLLRAIEGDEEEMIYCTPILGPGLADSLFGARRDIARYWAATYQFPMARHDEEDLSKVAHYLAVSWKDPLVRSELRALFIRELLQRYDNELQEFHADDLPSKLYDLIQKVWTLRPEWQPLEFYRILAEMPFRIYVTTDPTNLLETALEAAGRPPRPIVCPWREKTDPKYDDIDPRYYEGDFDLSSDRPLVYYPFGSLQVPSCLVMTEDDYYDFLIGITRNWHMVPYAVRGALARHGLLFLGFGIEERDFRVLLRSVLNLMGRIPKVPSVAAQVFPEESYVQEPERARRYLERYFQTAEINIYWGNTEDFMRELARRWNDRGS